MRAHHKPSTENSYLPLEFRNAYAVVGSPPSTHVIDLALPSVCCRNPLLGVLQLFAKGPLIVLQRLQPRLRVILELQKLGLVPSF